MTAITPFPWHALPRAERSALGRARILRRELDRAFELTLISNALSELLASEIEIGSAAPSLAALPSFAAEVVCIQSRDRSLAIMIEVEADLAAAAVARLLGRPLPSAALNPPLDSALRGALAAIVLDVTRRASKDPILEYVPSLASELRQEQGLLFACSVRLDRRRYGARVWFVAAANRSTPSSARDRLEALASLPLGVPVVVGVASSTRNDLESLLPGDVWLAGDGWSISSRLDGHGLLAAPRAEWGVAVDVSRERIVVGKAHRALAVAVEPNMMSEKDPTDGLSQTAIEVPIVVRVEIGSVTLSAAEWAALGVGDVIETATELSGPVSVVRAGGQQLAQGELVNLDGRIGVRITALGVGARA